ncbi:MAG TPA: glycosyltransferase family 39 protein [Patescibacteria group bacterium]|nr:glycosyltransferase family 39 protein [Patescibacteria group bacterium]
MRAFALFRQKPWILFAIFLYLFSFWLRWWKLQHISPFGDDMARDAFVVLQHIGERTPFVLGPKASVGNFYVQPIYYYLMAIPMFLSGGNPESASMMIVVLESLTPVLLYLIGRRYWKESAGQVMGVLYAISPFAITFGSYAWSPNLIPLTSTLMLFGVLEYVVRKNTKGLLVAITAAVLALQMHYQAFSLMLFMATVFGYIVLFRRKDMWWWLGGSVLGAATLLPLLFDVPLATQNFVNIYKFFTQEHAQYFQTTRTFPFFWNNIPRFFELVYGFMSDGYRVGRIIYLVGFTFLGVQTLWRMMKMRSLTADAVFLWFALVSFISLRLYKGDKLDYYLLFMTMLPVMLLGVVYAAVDRFKVGRWMFGALFVWLAVTAWFQFPAKVHEPQHDYEKLRKFVRVLDAEIGADYAVVEIPYTFFKDPLRFAFLSEGGSSRLDESGASKKPHVYICSVEQFCEDGAYLQKENEHPETLLGIEQKEHALGRKKVKSFLFAEEQLRLEVVVYE